MSIMQLPPLDEIEIIVFHCHFFLSYTSSIEVLIDHILNAISSFQSDSFKTEVNQLIDYRLHPTGVSLADTTTISRAASKTCAGSDIEWAYLSKETGEIMCHVLQLF